MVDALGEPLDGLAPISCEQGLQGNPINPMQRQAIDRVLDVGVKINAMLTVGCGNVWGLSQGPVLAKRFVGHAH